jgi:hypothetical protein
MSTTGWRRTTLRRLKQLSLLKLSSTGEELEVAMVVIMEEYSDMLNPQESLMYHVNSTLLTT